MDGTGRDKNRTRDGAGIRTGQDWDKGMRTGQETRERTEEGQTRVWTGERMEKGSIREGTGDWGQDEEQDGSGDSTRSLFVTRTS